MDIARTPPIASVAPPMGEVTAIHSPRPPATILVPAILVAGAISIPIVYLLVRTLGAGGEPWELLFRLRTLEILIRSAFLVVTVTGVSIILALPLAWLTVRTDLPGRGFWAVLSVLPLVIPSYVGGFIVVAALGPRGMVQQFLAPIFGIERLPDIYGLPGATLTLALLSFPYVLLTVRGALWGFDHSLEETSRSLGKGPWTTFIKVVLPQLRPAIAAGGLLVALYTLSDFGAVSLLRCETFTWAIYIQYETAFDRSLAAALSLVLVVVALAILLFEAKSRGRSVYYRSGAGVKRAGRLITLGRWRWPALTFCSIIVLVSLILPIGILGYWLARGVSAGEPLLLLWTSMRNSIAVSGLAAVAAVVAALPLAVLAVRYPGRISAFLERISYTGFALPGIVVALALVFFGVNVAWPLYQTLALLIFAYVVLFLPSALGAARASLLQLNPRLEETARSLGRKPLNVFTTITLPLIRPGLLAGAALVFLITMKELPATLILAPIGFKTLATSTWSAASEAFFAQAAAPALLLILASSIPMAFLILRERGRQRSHS